MKRFISLISVFILIFSFCITAFSFKIDGSEDSVEWVNSDVTVLLSGEESNSGIDFGSVKWTFDNGSLFICFNFYETGFNRNESNIGLSFAIEDSEYYTFETETSTVFDSDKYRVEAAMQYDAAYGAVCEARVGFKYGMPSQINGKVRFIDSEGAYSNVYYFILNANTYDEPYYEPEVPTTKPPKTTTTKPLTVKSTTAKPEKTTQNTTTTQYKTTTQKSNENNIDWLNMLLEADDPEPQPPKTTKEKTTKEKTAKEKTTKEKITKAKTAKSKTEKNTNENVAKTSKVIQNINSETNPLTNSVVQTIYIVQTEIVSETSISTSDGKKYQMITAIAGAVTLITVAVLGTLGANKKANKNGSGSSESDSSTNE